MLGGKDGKPVSNKAPEKIAYCQIDAHLDSNPKIRRAGRDGRDVFEFLLRRVAIGCTAGTVPIQYIEPWYLADVLMMTEDEARHGTSRAVTARLIEIDETAGVVRIVGWSDEWGRRPKSGAERTRKWRDGQPKSPESGERVTASDACDEQTSHVTVGDESDVGEERRREEKREREDARADYDPDSPEQRGELRKRTWARLSEARVSIAAELGITGVHPLTAITPAANPRGYRDLGERIREEGGEAPAVCDRVVESLIADARDKRNVDWLSEKAFSEGGWRTAKEAIPKRARRAPRQAEPREEARSPMMFVFDEEQQHAAV